MPADPLHLDPRTTALILIDLQHAITARQLAPHSAQDVVQRCVALANAFRAKGALVVYVRVDLAHMLQLPVDSPMRKPTDPPPLPNASELVPEAGYQPTDLLITKRQWGAFFGTDLEAQLRARNIATIVIAGIATNFGVESTARAAAGLGFATLLAEDATSSLSPEAHAFAYTTIFPRLARIRPTQTLLAALQ
jgi:nicotinamidase-related amidase